jgi:hypothetical protein
MNVNSVQIPISHKLKLECTQCLVCCYATMSVRNQNLIYSMIQGIQRAVTMLILLGITLQYSACYPVCTKIKLVIIKKVLRYMIVKASVA